MSAPVLVVGGTGNIGSACVKQLSEKGISVRALVRDPESDKAKKISGLENVTLVKGDVSDAASVSGALDGVRAAFLVLSNTKDQVTLEKSFIDAAAACSSCEYLVKVGTCRAEGYTTKESPIEYARMHAEIEEHLESVTSLKWTALNPNYFMQNHMGDIFGTLPQNLVIYPMPPDAKARCIDTRDIGAVGAALLSAEDATPYHSKFLHVCGPEPVSTGDLAALYDEATGRRINAIQVTQEEMAKAFEGAGFADWLASAVATGMADWWGTGKMDYESSAEVLELCPPKRTMKEWIAEHIALSPPPPCAP